MILLCYNVNQTHSQTRFFFYRNLYCIQLQAKPFILVSCVEFAFYVFVFFCHHLLFRTWQLPDFYATFPAIWAVKNKKQQKKHIAILFCSPPPLSSPCCSLQTYLVAFAPRSLNSKATLLRTVLQCLFPSMTSASYQKRHWMLYYR